jgi:hypothetical protein
MLTLIAIIAIVVSLVVLLFTRGTHQAKPQQPMNASGHTPATPSVNLASPAPSKQIDDAGVARDKPLLDEPSVLVFAFGAGFAVIAWTYRKLLDHLGLRAELAVTEALSDGRPRSREDITPLARRRMGWVGCFPGLTTDAVASLMAKGKLDVKYGLFSIAEAKKDPGRTHSGSANTP